MEKKNKRLFILLMVLICLTGIVYWTTIRENKISIDKDIFRLEDYSKINKILLESPEGKVTLASNGSRWKVNEKYNVDFNLINVLVATLQQAESKRPVATSQRDSISSALEKDGVHVSLFSDGNIVQEFYAGGNKLKTQAYFKAANSNDVYVMTIPGYRVYVSGIFEVNEGGWRDKYFFGVNGRNFQGLRAVFPDKPSENFKVALDSNKFDIIGMNADTSKLNTFLDNVLLLTAMEYINQGQVIDSLARLRPFMVITVTDIANKDFVLKIFKGSENQIPGLLNENQGLILNRGQIRSVLRPKSFFKPK